MGKSKIIAEIGQNHCGNMQLAKILIGLARLYGADLVKFQLYDHKKLYGNNGGIPNVELSYEQAKELFEYGKMLDIEVFFSVFDTEHIRWCEEIGVKRYKIPYKWRGNKELVEAVRATNKPVMVSSYKPEFGDTLYCISEYPASIEDIDWSQMEACNGFSDHTIGIGAVKEAIRRGSKVIEKHFAINHETGVDAEWSMDPKELKDLVRFAR